MGEAMFRINMKCILILCAIFYIGMISSGSAEECQFSCNLSCNTLGPHPAETKAKGTIAFQLDESKQELTYKLELQDIKNVYMAHLHIGPSNKQGPIAVWLYPFHDHGEAQRCIEGEFNGTLAEGVIRPEDLDEDIGFDELIKAMRDGNTYVNVHTKKYVPGEIRGQVQPSI